MPLPDDVEPTTTDLVLDALATVFVFGIGPAVDLLRRSLDALLTDPEVPDLPRTMALGCWVAFALGDDAAAQALADQLIAVSRDRGAYQILPEALDYLGQHHLRMGSLAAAEACFAEERDIEALSGRNLQGEVVQLLVGAWRGREDEVRAVAAGFSDRIITLGMGLALAWIQYALLILDLGNGDFEAAAARRPGELDNDVALGLFKAADEIEAHSRGGDRDVAAARLLWLSERTSATRTRLQMGLVTRARALLADDDHAEGEYQESMDHFTASGAELHLARTQLVYGEWLRRQKRRRDARTVLDAALATFELSGVAGFANRARAELLASGGAARARPDQATADLTPQEAQIARLAAEGATNPEIAGRLFISAKTVEYHLQKVYRKLEIGSRRELQLSQFVDPLEPA